MSIQALIILLVVVVTIIRATPINDGDAAVGFEKEQQVVDSAMLESRSNAGMKRILFYITDRMVNSPLISFFFARRREGASCSNDSQCSCRAGYRRSCSGGSCKCTFIK